MENFLGVLKMAATVYERDNCDAAASNARLPKVSRILPLVGSNKMPELDLKLRKNGQQLKNMHATCNTTMLQNELNSDVVRFTNYIKPVMQQIRLLTGLNGGGKTRNIAFQLALHQCCETSRPFLLLVLPKLKIIGGLASYG